MCELRGILGRYETVRELGSGETGTIYLDKRIKDFEQTVVLKVLRWTPIANLAMGPIESEHVILRFLEHPNIVTLLDHGRTQEGAPVLVLEYLDGTAINTWCDDHRLTIRERLVLLGQVFSAVSYAHSHLVLQGDIKPDNIMVTSLGNGVPLAKLLDFGVSRLLYGGRAISGLTGATIAYASPEQRHGERLTVATDVFALGVLMSSLLCGVEAVPNGRESWMSVRFLHFDSVRQQKLAAHRGTTPRALARLLRGSLDAIVQKATSFSPEDRYVSVAAMADDVGRYLEMVETSVYPLRKPQQAQLWMRRQEVKQGNRGQDNSGP